MRKVVNRWSPDTCGCVIDFEFDADDPSPKPVGKSVVKSCQAHSFPDAVSAHSSILEENQMKNRSINKIAELFPEYAVVDSKLNSSPDLNKISYSFDSNRKLLINVKGIKADHKTGASQALHSMYGANKVEII